MQETLEIRVRSLGREDPLERYMATHSSILAWRIPWTEEPGGLQPIGSQRVRHNWSNLACMQPEGSTRIKREATPPQNVKSNLTGTGGHGPALHHPAHSRFSIQCSFWGLCSPFYSLVTSGGSLHLPVRCVCLVHLIHIADPGIEWGAEVTRLRCSQPPGEHTKRLDSGLWQTCMQESAEQRGGPGQAKPRDTYIFVTGWQASIPAYFQASRHWSESGKCSGLTVETS